ncbi:hypothetical protein ACFFV7_51060 [Nonomuraea spiralis]|uniref:Uncharacterized protein n=1 Tax=Nonomuraea spiralis TaxID=46182 RepID=A0ABV5IZD0_9ACTN|nr:hypothetical protein [Nonomuraea spiralis]GGS88348.1 hypothetical protein GCM10010176_035140 [Nonomuraea spiralis]
MTAAWLQARRAEWARAANLKPCPSCKATVLAGLDADHTAMPVRCDPTPLTEMGEAVALLQDRTTYDLLPTKTGRELHERTPHFISKPRRYQVFATHKCNNPLIAFIQHTEQKATVHNDDRPPF